jgi:ankyrin repeat protein
VVKILLKAAEIDVNAASRDGYTPLWLATFKGHSKVVELLIGAGADANHAALDGTTPLWVAIAHGHDRVVELLTAAGPGLSWYDRLKLSASMYSVPLLIGAAALLTTDCVWRARRNSL